MPAPDLGCGYATARVHNATRRRGYVAAPSRAQQPAMPVIGYFSARSSESDVPYLAPFRQGTE